MTKKLKPPPAPKHSAPITVIKSAIGSPPSYVLLGHRHLEKAHPPPIDHLGTTMGIVRFRVPTDLIRMGLPQGIGDDVETVELVYRKG